MPIIAVSASLVERSQREYVAAGFDGWITKPIDFKRLEKIIHAVGSTEGRKLLAYGISDWEDGGWFVS
jgi:CheY-like chemotaxis protein